MRTIFASPGSPSSSHRPQGITAIAVACALIAAYLCASGLLTSFGILPLASGAPLLSGLEIMGPTIFFLCAAITAVTAIGLLRMHRWARRLASVLTIALLIPAVPAISSAVADLRILAIVREALRFIVAVAAFRYLNTGPVRDAFS